MLHHISLFTGRGLTINLPIFNELITKRNDVSKEAAIQAMSLGDSRAKKVKLRSFNPELLSRPWVSIEMDGRHMDVLWATSTRNMWLELTVLGLFVCCFVCGFEKLG